MIILAIDTSCDETSVAVCEGRKILSNKIYSQILIHKKWGGVVPNLAKRAHEERIDMVIEEAVMRSKRDSSELGIRDHRRLLLAQTSTHFRNLFDLSMKQIDYIAVTYGPGLAPALEVGINKAKELAKKYHKKLIAINHLEGHIYSCFAQNNRGNPKREYNFPYLALVVSGGHTELILFHDHLKYEVIGETIDDAAGEALDKAAKLLGLGYPGGAVIERLAKTGDFKYHNFPRPMSRTHDLNFSFSGLKTSFYYHLQKMSINDKAHNLNNLAASYQEAVFESIIKKIKLAIERVKINRLVVGGGVIANVYLRNKIRNLARAYNGDVIFPTSKSLYGDNAAMIGVAANYKAEKGIYVKNVADLERMPRLKIAD
ncbi:hypothetical protein A3C23_05900 [Candidatus Roizmanbacteria bacterium RIFCSPHIGHO2_02_FULL_37_13b]|uniref:tRNA N6-adenosine threonylcarbamoyltransferase n=1 Tax=Candidatus Roizmanbacteria bacterium RIFCSPLOWO2_02_FULL_36_11 TaxID=1802071 RepID=A0A1F7JCQ8_9BACT|nr:MAG: hypothetical protein A3C23_05900 [Candidatus Roizmanbacteria bacterium RIFCSPHIGHO2_02_FULL_37_13b]OGK53399.1 MAG: hypothetical protein A3H78_02550 [Candidatus Roizmanbacteria bacterium RIFCSPLOWO2_02_FULL_36_11]